MKTGMGGESHGWGAMGEESHWWGEPWVGVGRAMVGENHGWGEPWRRKADWGLSWERKEIGAFFIYAVEVLTVLNSLSSKGNTTLYDSLVYLCNWSIYLNLLRCNAKICGSFFTLILKEEDI